MSARRGLVLAALGLLVLALAADPDLARRHRRGLARSEDPLRGLQAAAGARLCGRSAWAAVAERFRRAPGRPRLLHRPHHLRRRAGLERSDRDDRGRSRCCAGSCCPTTPRRSPRRDRCSPRSTGRPASTRRSASSTTPWRPAQFAYGDIVAAFVAFRREIGDRPFILVGVEQGGALGRAAAVAR